MEKNNFNKAYIYIIAIFAIGIAISNIISFFNGVGFALIGTSVLLALAISNILKDENNKKRFGDIFLLIILEIMMLIVLFFAYDFNLNGMTNKFPLVMRNIYAIYSLFATGYVIFRYISEIKGKKYKFVEYLLGNYTPEPRVKVKKTKLTKEQIKKNKELENGTLEPKPSSIENLNEQTIDSNVTSENAEEVAQEENKTAENAQETKEQTANNNVYNRTNFW